MKPSDSKLDLDCNLVAQCHDHARAIARAVTEAFERRSTVSVERSVARLFGIDGVDEHDVPLPNVVIDRLEKRGALDRGVAWWLGCAMHETGLSASELAHAVAHEGLDLCDFASAPGELAVARARQAARTAWSDIRQRREQRRQLRQALGESEGTAVYVLTATGNVHEDVIHARAVANYGGDIVAVIRSTAQSLLDYVPYGPTTEGYGGTFATQENFRILREALDEWSKENSRYIQLSSFCSGLCMPEIAVMGAIEGLDNMVNDAMYGTLYRDINMERTFIDQRISRMINGAARIVINTGEDNYLRTADAVDAAPSVVASQMINYHLARESLVPDELIAVGNAFEIDPNVTNSLLLEWAQSQLTRELFPHCPVKFMPPTKHMNGNVLRTHATDTLFNLVSTATRQGIQTIGVPTEGIFTPHIHDRTLALESVTYVARAARDLYREIQFTPHGIMQRRAQQVLRDGTALLQEIRDEGLFEAIAKGRFGNVRRSRDGGKGREGIIVRADDYFEPFAEIIEQEAA